MFEGGIYRKSITQYQLRCEVDFKVFSDMIKGWPLFSWDKSDNLFHDYFISLVYHGDYHIKEL